MRAVKTAKLKFEVQTNNRTYYMTEVEKDSIDGWVKTINDTVTKLFKS